MKNIDVNKCQECDKLKEETLLVKKNDFILFMAEINNCSAQTKSRNERIKIIVKSAGEVPRCKRAGKRLDTLGNTLRIVLKLFNLIWHSGQLPSAFKHAVIVPILKPGKDSPSDPSRYRPIALTSQLCKITEQTITERLTYFLKSKELLSPYQSGFREGRNTMDLCLESDVRKAQGNKEVVSLRFSKI